MALLTVLMGLALSFGLAWAYAGVLYWADRHEKEPKRLLLGMFLWGAFIATVGSALFSAVIDAGLNWVWGNPGATRELFDAAVVAPLVEESLKGVALLVLFALARHEIDSLFDGIIYGALVGLGFEAVENALYIIGSLGDGVGQMLLVMFLRLGLFGFTHAFYTGLTGLGLAVFRLYSSRWWAWFAPLAGWGAAVLAHALHNASMTLGGAVCLLGLSTDWLGLLALVGLMAWSIHRERQWLRRYLVEDVQAGRIGMAHYRTACSLTARRKAVQRARRKGPQYARATRDFYRHLTDLAFLRAHIQRGHRGPRERERLQRLQTQVQHLAPYAEVAA